VSRILPERFRDAKTQPYIEPLEMLEDVVITSIVQVYNLWRLWSLEEML
jgi:hypothetical protein